MVKQGGHESEVVRRSSGNQQIETLGTVRTSSRLEKAINDPPDERGGYRGRPGASDRRLGSTHSTLDRNAVAPSRSGAHFGDPAVDLASAGPGSVSGQLLHASHHHAIQTGTPSATAQTAIAIGPSSPAGSDANHPSPRRAQCPRSRRSAGSRAARASCHPSASGRPQGDEQLPATPLPSPSSPARAPASPPRPRPARTAPPPAPRSRPAARAAPAARTHDAPSILAFPCRRDASNGSGIQAGRTACRRDAERSVPGVRPRGMRGVRRNRHSRRRQGMPESENCAIVIMRGVACRGAGQPGGMRRGVRYPMPDRVPRTHCWQ